MADFQGVWHINCPIIGHVLILALDTSSPSGSVAVLRDDKVVGSFSTSTDEVYSARMFRHVEFLLHELSLRLDEFDLFAVAAGPGSFTGLRVGLATVKGWAEVYRKPIAAISGLEAVAAQSHSRVPLLVPVLDARRSQIYFGFYRRLDAARLALEGQECVATPEEFAQALDARAPKSDFAIVTPVPVLVRELLSRLETTAAPRAAMPIDEVSPILAPHIGKLGYLRSQRGELSDALTLDANYVRRSDAELHWKDPSAS
ncbi:MAG: tRNA (adenosine(37)-N6)-threonylcarbamoyltransferase complex dimerization subunit type 1 TsaB [Candidatus Acidiferrales bacterium]